LEGSVRRRSRATDVRVLSFAAVAFHGREWWPTLIAAALALTTSPVPALAQPPAAFMDLAPDFAATIARAVGTDAAVRVAFPPDQARLQAEIVRVLATRGVRIADTGDATVVNASCATNLRDRVCVAEIGGGEAHRVVMTSRPRAPGLDPDAAPIVGIELRSIYTQRAPILDVTAAGDRLLVLTPDAVVLVGDASGANNGGRAIAAKPITTARVWPRDLRGRLRAAAPNFEAFLPGVTCRGTINPFALVCADDSEPWPIGLDNSGIAPSRNAFSTADGFTFYEAAPVGGGRFLLASERSVLTLTEAGRRTALRGDPADHVAGFPDACAADAPYVVTDARTSESDRDALRLFRFADARLVASGSTTTLPGALTALWSATASGPATAIVHDLSAGRYEAFHLTLPCAR
jgi:hypothetical protein